MNASVDLTEYSGLVQQVLLQARNALAPQLGDGPRAAADGLGNVSGLSPATRVLGARFAMGVDPVTYLNNGVAVLAAGTHDEALDVSGLAGADVLTGVKNAVYRELQRKEKYEYSQAAKRIEELRPLVAWLLCIPQVAHFVSDLEDEEFNAPFQLVYDANTDELIAEASAAMSGYVVTKATREFLCKVFELLARALDPQSGPRRLLEQMFKDIDRRIDEMLELDATGQWKRFKKAVETLPVDPPLLQRTLEVAPDTNSDLQLRFDLLEEEIAAAPRTQVAQAAQAAVVSKEKAKEWYRECLGGSSQPVLNSNVALWAVATGIVGEYGPGESRPLDAVYFRYSTSLLKSLALPPRPSPRENLFLQPLFDDYCRGLRGEYDLALSVSLPGCDVIDAQKSLTMKVRWKPQGDLEVDQARAAILEHVIRNMDELANTTPDGEKHNAIIATAKMMQLEHLQRIRASEGDVGRGLGDIGNEWTVNAEYTADVRGKIKIGHPVYRKAGDDTFTIGDDNGFQNETRPTEKLNEVEAALEAARRCAEKMVQEYPGYPGAPLIPSDSDYATMRPADPTATDENPVETKTRKGKTVKIDAALLSTDALFDHMRTGIRVCHLAKNGPVEVGGPYPGAPLPKPTAGPEQTRAVLWKEMLREISISSDRLWVFVKLLSGSMGDSADTLLTVADEAAQRAQKAFEAEKKSVSEKTSAFHTKLVEAVVGGILRGSKLEAIPDHKDGADGLFVADAELAKDIRALASGESGRPFFEANVAIQGVLRAKNGKKSSLGDIIASLDPIVQNLNESMQMELANSAGGALGVAALSAPRNSYMVSLRDDVVASIRISYDRLCHELGSRRISLWELVEGASSSLSLRWAEFVSHVLVATRASSGTSAMFVSQQMVATNILQTRAALVRLVSECRGYMGTFSKPDFSHPKGRQIYFDASVGKQTPLTTPGAVAPTVVVGRVLVNSDVSGWIPGSHPYLR